MMDLVCLNLNIANRTGQTNRIHGVPQKYLFNKQDTACYKKDRVRGTEKTAVMASGLQCGNRLSAVFLFNLMVFDTMTNTKGWMSDETVSFCLSGGDIFWTALLAGTF